MKAGNNSIKRSASPLNIIPVPAHIRVTGLREGHVPYPSLSPYTVHVPPSPFPD